MNTGKIAVFKDNLFKAMPEYNADDVLNALTAHGHTAEFVNADELATLSRKVYDTLVFPYINGALKENSLNGMTAFHSAGGGLVVLGAMPHRMKWYPYRNSEAWRFKMTSGNGPFTISGLTEYGRQILGMDDLPFRDFFAGKTLRSLRVTPYPPDQFMPLLNSDNRDYIWHSTPLFAVQRYGQPFLGARFAMVAFGDGEPRENAAGAYQLPWNHNPGILTREWKGMDIVLEKLVTWCTPKDAGISFDFVPTHIESDNQEIKLIVKNLTDSPNKFKIRVWSADDEYEEISQIKVFGPGETLIRLQIPNRKFGIHRHSAEISYAEKKTSNNHSFVDYNYNAAGHMIASCSVREFVIPQDANAKQCFGFSTFRAFPHGQLLPDFKDFCNRMRDCGCQYVRVNVPWEDLEPDPGCYNWELPDAFLEYARHSGLTLFFWVFPTTRGSGLGDAGVPWWSLHEPSMSIDGEAGYFPTLWSKFYREHYYNMVRAFVKRYANAPELGRFIIDFGNSDFPYGYFYYGGNNSIFDYSPIECAAFRKFVRERISDNLSEVSEKMDVKYRSWDDVTVPLPSQTHAWREYLVFRAWSVQTGIVDVANIIKDNAPDKLPPDLPGHGAGSLADISSYCLDAKKRHLAEELPEEAVLAHLHNSGSTWGGEAWQVGARYQENDDSLFNSVLLNAKYMTMPGTDIGVYGEDTARIGFIRRTIAGSERDTPQFAVIDSMSWSSHRSLAQVATRLDQEVDLLCGSNRHDMSCYKLLVLPPFPWNAPGTGTGGGASCLTPRDAAWWKRLRNSAENGLNVLMFPGTTQTTELPLSDSFAMPKVQYGEKKNRMILWPESFRGGESFGFCQSVHIDGAETLVSDSDGEPILVRYCVGKGSILFAGYDTDENGLDGSINEETTKAAHAHTLARLLNHFGIKSKSIDTGDTYIWKSIIRRDNREFLILFSHQKQSLTLNAEIHSERNLKSAWDLATGEHFAITPGTKSGWWKISVEVTCRTGRYIVLE